MNRRIFVACVIILLTLGGLFYYRAQSCELKVSFNLQLRVLADDSLGYNGFGSMYSQKMNFSVLKWPNLDSDKVDLSLTRPDNKTSADPVKFDIVLNLNQTKKIIEIPPKREVGWYDGSITCFFKDVKSGTYNLTIGLNVNGILHDGFKECYLISLP